MEWLWGYLIVGFIIFVIGLTRADETAWVGFRAVPEVFVFQLLTFVLFWPILLALELNRR